VFFKNSAICFDKSYPNADLGMYVAFENQFRLSVKCDSKSLGVIWSSEEAHMVDALATEGDEGRGSLR
jgi:hypothetical protein